MANVLFDRVQAHDAGGFISILLTVLAAITVAVYPMQHWTELLPWLQCLGLKLWHCDLLSGGNTWTSVLHEGGLSWGWDQLL